MNMDIHINYIHRLINEFIFSLKRIIFLWWRECRVPVRYICSGRSQMSGSDKPQDVT
jgi:hypothetical protein